MGILQPMPFHWWVVTGGQAASVGGNLRWRCRGKGSARSAGCWGRRKATDESSAQHRSQSSAEKDRKLFIICLSTLSLTDQTYIHNSSWFAVLTRTLLRLKLTNVDVPVRRCRRWQASWQVLSWLLACRSWSSVWWGPCRFGVPVSSFLGLGSLRAISSSRWADGFRRVQVIRLGPAVLRGL